MATFDEHMQRAMDKAIEVVTTLSAIKYSIVIDGYQLKRLREIADQLSRARDYWDKWEYHVVEPIGWELNKLLDEIERTKKEG